ncbi:hypothetical protein [Sphaerospermopsis sp. FACHB-1194]|uniref:hypothetical protein n=1 Tax=Sphaerospermopsis sp. FACHB-1194 TaxID=2692862 RepID=UPI0016805AA7|nr:hypothetical protein [Sphaerospermopsis sp. FACHB-1194]MBD2145485.1 hypothetical protein [Sphaerospermopsis sp. FACHB-1194]
MEKIKLITQSPVTSHQSPVTSHQSPVTSHQSPVTSHQSPVTSLPTNIWLKFQISTSQTFNNTAGICIYHFLIGFSITTRFT